jgi:hypothetical protein
LSNFTQRIIKGDHTNGYIYLTTPYSVSIVRHEKNRLAQIITASTAKLVKEVREKATDEKDTTKRQVLDQYMSQELRLDGPSRFHALTNDRLLMVLQTGEIVIMHVKFDQADIDVAEVGFQKFGTKEEKIVPSMISVLNSNKPS